MLRVASCPQQLKVKGLSPDKVWGRLGGWGVGPGSCHAGHFDRVSLQILFCGLVGLGRCRSQYLCSLLDVRSMTLVEVGGALINTWLARWGLPPALAACYSKTPHPANARSQASCVPSFPSFAATALRHLYQTWACKYSRKVCNTPTKTAMHCPRQSGNSL